MTLHDLIALAQQEIRQGAQYADLTTDEYIRTLAAQGKGWME